MILLFILKIQGQYTEKLNKNNLQMYKFKLEKINILLFINHINNVCTTNISQRLVTQFWVRKFLDF